MQLAARSHIATGVAVVAASALAISPIAPPAPELPDIRDITSVGRNVALSALANPFAPVFQQAFEDVQALVERIVADPAPILQQIIENQLRSAETLAGLGGDYVQDMVHFLTGNEQGTSLRGQLEAAGKAFQEGDYGLAFSLVSVLPILALTAGNVFGTLDTVVPTLAGLIQQPFEHIGATIGVFADPQNILPLAMAIVLGTAGTAQVIGEAFEGIEAALRGGGGPEAVVNAILTGSAATLGSMSSAVIGPNGLIAGLLTLRTAIAQAIAPPAEAPAVTTTSGNALAANEVPNDGARFVSMTLGPAPANTGELSSGADKTATDPEPDAPASGGTDKDDEDEPTSGITDDTEKGAAEEPGTKGGATDLSGGNKVTPGDKVTDDTGTGTGTGTTGTGTGTGTDATRDATDEDAGTGADTGTTGSDSDSSDSDSGGSDSGTE